MPREDDIIPEQLDERLAAVLLARDRTDRVVPSHWIWRIVGVAGSAAVAVSAFLPWLPLRGVERENLIELVATLTRIGVPHTLWLIPPVLGLAGIVVSIIRHRQPLRGVAMVALAAAGIGSTTIFRPDLLRAFNAAALMPMGVASFGSGPYLYAAGITAMCVSGFLTCWRYRRARIFVLATVACGLAVCLLVPRLRDPFPRLTVRPGDGRAETEPVRIVHVQVENRKRYPISVVDAPPDMPNPDVYVLSLSKRNADLGTFTEVPVYTVSTPATSFPLTVGRRSSIELGLEFRPAWETVPDGGPVFAVSAAGTYLLRLSSSARGRRVERQFVVEPVGHPETAAAALLDEVRHLVAEPAFAEAKAVAQRLSDSYPNSWAAGELEQLAPYINAAASLDAEIAVAEQALARAAQLESGGAFAEAAALIETTGQRLDSLAEKLPDDRRLAEVAERVARRHIGLRAELHSTQAHRLFGKMRAALDAGDIEQAGGLARKLDADYSTSAGYAELRPEIERTLRREALAQRFKLVSIVHVGPQVRALLRDTVADKSVTVRSGDLINDDIRVTRIDDPAGTVLLAQGDVTHKLDLK